MLARNEKPEPQELAIGIDLVVAAMVLLSGFLPGSSGSVLDFRLVGLGALFVMLTAMALLMRMYGYKTDSSLYRRDETTKRYFKVQRERLTGATGWSTSIVGCVVLGGFWWLNLNAGLVAAAWKGAVH